MQQQLFWKHKEDGRCTCRLCPHATYNRCRGCSCCGESFSTDSRIHAYQAGSETARY